MTEIQFNAAPFDDSENLFNNEYTNARYAPTGNQKVGDVFPLFKQPGYYFTDWNPSSQGQSNLKKELNLPTNNTLFRNTQAGDGVRLQNTHNIKWVEDSQSLKNIGTNQSCGSDGDCNNGYKCNSNYQSWSNAYGNQGNYCVKPSYPELESGRYTRLDTTNGGIGKSCNTDVECGSGYSCNKETDIFGKNVQQTGYCSQTYECQNGTHHLGYPYNSSIPISPPQGQNNNGQGYPTKSDCNNEKLAQQDCVRDNSGNWFATYPGLCPLPASKRSGQQALGALPSSGSANLSEGIKIPAYATNQSSSITKPNSAFAAWNINASLENNNEMSEPLRYEMRINPN
jgi:hypothetical protein